MKQLICLFGIAILSLSVRATGIEWSHLSVEKAIEQAGKEGKFVFIDVFATWCGPCKYLDKKVFPDEALGEYFNEHFISLELDGERGEGPAIMQQFELSAFPSLLFLNGEGKLVQKQVGAMDAEGLLSVAKEVVDPSSSPLYKMKVAFDEGKRDKEFLFEYMTTLLQRDQDPTEVAATYAKTYPELDLGTENEFLVFLFGVHDLEHPSMAEYLKDIAKFEERFPESSQYKIGSVLGIYGEQALEAGNPEIGLEAIRKLHPALKKLLGKEAPKLKELEEDFQEAYEEEMG